jgi:hypothetical protein
MQRSVQVARTLRQQVQVRLVLGEHHYPAGQFQQPGYDPGHHVVMVGSPRGSQLRPPPSPWA